jgi:hypothetical protein
VNRLSGCLHMEVPRRPRPEENAMKPAMFMWPSLQST